MSGPRDLVRVSRARPCPVCGRPDWCLVDRDDPPNRCLCARVADGARRKVTARDGSDVGWLHVLRDDGRAWHPRPITIPLTSAGSPDLGALADECRRAVDDVALARLADGLGLTIGSLRRLGVGWSARHRAWTWPMVDTHGRVRGIRLRYLDRRKLSVRGGHEGLFVPRDLAASERLLVCEGPTDTAALLGLGLAAVGRPSCAGGVGLLVDLVRRRREREVVIVADGDEPGRRGAANLAAVLVAYAPAVRIIEPPEGVKDARAWVRSGATAADVLRTIDAAEPQRLRVTTTFAGSEVRR